MADFTVVPRGASATYQDSTEKMGADIREAVHLITSRCGLSENDPVYAVLLSQAELLNSGLELQTNSIKAVLDGFVGARKAENKELAELLQANQAASKENVVAIRQACGASQQETATLVQESKKGREELEKTLKEIERKADERARVVIAASDRTTDTNKFLQKISVTIFWWIVAMSVATGVIGTLAFQHFIL